MRPIHRWWRETCEGRETADADSLSSKLTQVLRCSHWHRIRPSCRRVRARRVAASRSNRVRCRTLLGHCRRIYVCHRSAVRRHSAPRALCAGILATRQHLLALGRWRVGHRPHRSLQGQPASTSARFKREWVSTNRLLPSGVRGETGTPRRPISRLRSPLQTPFQLTIGRRIGRLAQTVRMFEGAEVQV